MSKEQENLREQFIEETKSKLWAEDINEDVGFSDKYVEWLETKQLILSGVVKCNCYESEQLEEEFEIHHLINDTYQVIGKDSNTVWKQGTLEDCNEFVML